MTDPDNASPPQQQGDKRSSQSQQQASGERRNSDEDHQPSESPDPLRFKTKPPSVHRTLIGQLRLQVLEARDVATSKLSGSQNSYVQLTLADGTSVKTLPCKGSGSNPYWYEGFIFDVYVEDEKSFQGDLYYETWNNTWVLAGRFVIDFDRMIEEGRERSDKWFTLWRRNLKPGGAIHMTLKFEKAKPKLKRRKKKHEASYSSLPSVRCSNDSFISDARGGSPASRRADLIAFSIQAPDNDEEGEYYRGGGAGAALRGGVLAARFHRAADDAFNPQREYANDPPMAAKLDPLGGASGNRLGAPQGLIGFRAVMDPMSITQKIRALPVPSRPVFQASKARPALPPVRPITFPAPPQSQLPPPAEHAHRQPYVSEQTATKLPALPTHLRHAIIAGAPSE